MGMKTYSLLLYGFTLKMNMCRTSKARNNNKKGNHRPNIFFNSQSMTLLNCEH